jgi:hypothetical protein
MQEKTNKDLSQVFMKEISPGKRKIKSESPKFRCKNRIKKKNRARFSQIQTGKHKKEDRLDHYQAKLKLL